MPPFAKAAYATAASQIKGGDEHVKQEQSKQGEQGTGQNIENQGIINGAAEEQATLQGGQQAAKDADGEMERAEGSSKSDKPGTEGQPGDAGTKQQQVGTSTEKGPKTTAYDEMLCKIEDEIFHARGDETPEDQLKRAPAVASLIQSTASKILTQFQDVARYCDAQGHRDHFVSTLQDTAFALLWILESCALNMGGTVLSAEVSRTLSRDALVGALWGTVRLAKPSECLQLVSYSPSPFLPCSPLLSA